jgi:hypothetical protein
MLKGRRYVEVWVSAKLDASENWVRRTGLRYTTKQSKNLQCIRLNDVEVPVTPRRKTTTVYHRCDGGGT